ncbi:NAD-dependent epimerase/dehydratase family protein [Streptosporangium sp. NPDC002524]|uniref:NAD-dependent epimerase/dehydratase family protein n=1 Tax=Streptosporangium sp. NPDC002524 TaxID=3154537 RepID=UPI003331252D
MLTELAELAGARVLITGGAGLIGAAIARQLRALGATTTVLDDLSGYDRDTYALLGATPDAPGLIVGDINDRPLIDRLTRGSDFVIHAAAFSTVAGCVRDPDAAFHANIAGTHQVLRAAAKAATLRRLVFISSAQVYGHGVAGLDKVQIFTEDQPMSPLNPYATAKLWAETHTRHLLESAGVDYAIVRPFSVYGEGQIPKPGAWSWVVAQFCMYASLGQPLPLNNSGRQVRDFVHVDDAAHAIIRTLIAPQASGATFNIGTGQTTSILQIAELVRSHLAATQFEAAPRPAGDPLGGRADITRMTGVLGWQPTIAVADGVTRYLAWLQATPQAIPAWLPGERDRVAAWNTSR